ncbi:hypothetical protein BD413DRAFT_530240 [Trametes elegans]|nr:hypothetical protein BD413DRAFT_530240 [Trametes elegans]
MRYAPFSSESEGEAWAMRTEGSGKGMARRDWWCRVRWRSPGVGVARCGLARALRYAARARGFRSERAYVRLACVGRVRRGLLQVLSFTSGRGGVRRDGRGRGLPSATRMSATRTVSLGAGRERQLGGGGSGTRSSVSPIFPAASLANNPCTHSRSTV